MDGVNLLDSFGIKLPEKLFYLVISANKAVVWHSLKSGKNTDKNSILSNGCDPYNLTEYFFADTLPLD